MSFTAEGARIKQKAVLDADDLSLVASGAFRVEFDVAENETHRSTAKATRHPVEGGARISDHIVQEPDSLDLIARVTNTPIVSEAEAFALTPGRAEEAYRTLQRVKESATLVSVLTTLREYRSMAIVEVSVTRNAQTGDVLAVSLKLEHIRTATSETIEVPTPRVARARVSSDLGKVPTTDATQAVSDRNQTILNRILGDFVP